MKTAVSFHCPLCLSLDGDRVFQYSAPPPGETAYSFSRDGSYSREVWRCCRCGHFVNSHEMNLEELYQGDYVNSTYGAGGILAAFQKIMGLPPERSDNVQRVSGIISFMAGHWRGIRRLGTAVPSVLDVGSGLCVFLQRMKENGWACTALDPDPRAVEHAQRTVGIQAICGDFLAVDSIGSYDLIAFNKVLEHVPDSVAMLGASAGHLNPNGIVYVEVPDGEMAALEGQDREEFFVDHRVVFSMASLCLLAVRAGFTALMTQRVHDPSGKYTLRAFLTAVMKRDLS